jgi:hypothetical protein
MKLCMGLVVVVGAALFRLGASVLEFSEDSIVKTGPGPMYMNGTVLMDGNVTMDGHLRGPTIAEMKSALTAAQDKVAVLEAAAVGFLGIGGQVPLCNETADATTRGRMFLDEASRRFYGCNGTKWHAEGWGTLVTRHRLTVLPHTSSSSFLLRRPRMGGLKCKSRLW